MNKKVKPLSAKIADGISLIVILGIIVVSVYAIFIAPKLWLNKVEINFQHTVNQMGKPVSYFTKQQCSKLQFITCQEMNEQNIEIIYWWSKGLDVNIVAGFDENHQLKYKKMVSNERLELAE